MADREQRFAKGCERNEAKHPELVASSNTHLFSMVDPLIEGEPVSNYVERVFSILALGIEEVIM